ncbi:hypothetical protein MUP56_00585, partial [Patescibacteria group bacterium]|nr:hypothetical protein [Patescibacteria group bacterium]
MSAQQELLAYIDSAREKGFSDEAIQGALQNAGWQKKDIQEALFPTKPQQNPSKESLSPLAIIISVLLFLLFGGYAAYGLFLYQNKLKITPSPTPIPVPGGTDKVAFVTGNEIWTMNLDGSDVSRVTSDGSAKLNLQWLPDG